MTQRRRQLLAPRTIVLLALCALGAGLLGEGTAEARRARRRAPEATAKAKAKARTTAKAKAGAEVVGGDAAGTPTGTAPRRAGRVFKGKASYYANKFQGRKTASGERFDQKALTAAHRSLPFGTRLRVTNVKNGKSVVVRVNDRGPYGPGRVVDLSLAAARQLEMVRAGVVPVTVEVVAAERLEASAAPASRRE